MHAVESEMETVHIYVVREEVPRPFVALPLFGAALCLLGIVCITLYSGTHPSYIHQTLRLPATFSSVNLQATEPVIPTGVQFYPATNAAGTLTIENGSVVTETLPVGMLFTATSGIEVQTEQAIYIPAGSATGYGVATGAARALQVGTGGNIATLAVNAVYGTALYVRNLSPFTGGRDAYTVTFTTPADRHTALLQARGILLSKSSGLHYPCAEDQSADARTMIVTWRCIFVSYHVPSFMHVDGVQLAGTQVLVSVVYRERPMPLGRVR